MTDNENLARENHGMLLMLFWAYVLVPLGWGVYQTFKKALVLFA